MNFFNKIAAKQKGTLVLKDVLMKAPLPAGADNRAGAQELGRVHEVLEREEANSDHQGRPVGHQQLEDGGSGWWCWVGLGGGWVCGRWLVMSG